MDSKTDKEALVAKMCSESVNVWCNNPLEAVALTQLAAMVHAYFKRYGEDGWAFVDYTSDDTRWRLQRKGIGTWCASALCNSDFWNVKNLEKVIAVAQPLPDVKVLAESVKFVITLDPTDAKFTLNVYYLKQS